VLIGASALIVAVIAANGVTGQSGRGDRGDDGDDDERRAGRYAVGMWGDVPYSDVQALSGVPNLIADMNRQNLAFSVHNGDLKAGSGTPGSVTPTTCVDELYEQSLTYFMSLRAAAMFTPGDNDWTDCDRPANGSFWSLDRLDHERTVFFSTSYSLGQRRIRQRVQEEPLCVGVSGLVPCVENRRWTVDGVTYITLNVQGSCNNLCDTAPDPVEWEARNEANIVWLTAGFADAKARRSAAVMLISQANPGWDQTDPRAPLRDPRTLAQTDGLPDGFQKYLLALREQVVAFRKPVAYVHGDSHYFRIDRPFLNAAGHRLENFTRVETFGNSAANGNNDVHWLKILVDPDSREVFAYQPQIVPKNRTAVP
jgi:hypothetical protein